VNVTVLSKVTDFVTFWRVEVALKYSAF